MLGAAACAVVLVGGLLAVVGSGSTNRSPAASTPTPASTALWGEGSWTGGLLGDIETDSLRPLDSDNQYAGDHVIPTAPSDWRVERAGRTEDDPLLYPNAIAWAWDVSEDTPDGQTGQHLYFRQSRFPTCLGCRASGESVTIDGVVWESVIPERNPADDAEFVEATILRARLDDYWLSVVVGAPELLNGPLLQDAQIIEFLEGIRVGDDEDLASIIDDAEIVVSDD